MQFKNVLLIAASILAPLLPGALAAEGDVHTATRVLQAVVTQSPFLVQQSTVVTWTQGASMTESTTPTVIPDMVQTDSAS